MIEELCGDDQKKWDDVLAIAQQALTHRISLWNGIEDVICRKRQLEMV